VPAPVTGGVVQHLRWLTTGCSSWHLMGGGSKAMFHKGKWMLVDGAPTDRLDDDITACQRVFV